MSANYSDHCLKQRFLEQKNAEALINLHATNASRRARGFLRCSSFCLGLCPLDPMYSIFLYLSIITLKLLEIIVAAPFTAGTGSKNSSCDNHRRLSLNMLVSDAMRPYACLFV